MKLLEKIKTNYILIGILFLAAILRVYHIDFQSVWLDEIHTLNESNPNLSLKEFYNTLLTSEMNPPLYFVFVRILFTIFGYKVIVLRLFSAILGVLGVYAIYVLGKEIENKKVGLISAILLSVNYFHLYHSQDGRPYVFFTLFSILAFYRLIIYIKKPNFRNAVLHGIFAALMIYGHLFGLFVLFTQYLLLLFFFIFLEKENKKRFFINSFFSGVITLILLIPMVELFIKSVNMNEFWIPAPTVDVYTLIFKEFFGNSELVLTLIGFLFLLYILSLSKASNFKLSYNSLIENKTIFNFIIFSFWIVVVILIPLARSYLSVPMIISRYFIVVLPAILLIISIGIYQFKNNLLQKIIVVIFVLFSITDITIVHNFYNGINKSQFKGATNFIIDNNQKKDPVVSSLGWYLSYFLKNEKINYEIIQKPIDSYIAEMQQDSTKIKPFWYMEAHGVEYKPSDATLAFINNNFYIDNNYDGFQAWTKHFILLKDVPKTIDISKFKNLQEYNGDGFMFNIEMFEFSNNIVKTSGWAFFEKHPATKSKYEVLLIKDGIAHRLQTQKVIRPDNTTYFKSDFDVSNSGFNSILDITSLPVGTYQLAVYLFNEETKKEGLILTKKVVEKK